MRRGGILHPQLAAVLARLGHGDLICVADAGLPIPAGVERVDLGFAPGHPSMVDVLTAMLDELVVERYWLAEPAPVSAAPVVRVLADRLPGTSPAYLPHEELKGLLPGARAVVRTGEFTAYANVIFGCGVPFVP